MSSSPPPTFDALFQDQQRAQQSPRQQDSFEYPIDANLFGFSSAGPDMTNFSQGFGHNEMSDEPGSIARRGSNASLQNQTSSTQASSAETMTVGLGTSRDPGLFNGIKNERQDSFPYDPTNTTLILTASQPNQTPGPETFTFGNQQQQKHFEQNHQQQQRQQLQQQQQEQSMSHPTFQPDFSTNTYNLGDPSNQWSPMPGTGDSTSQQYIPFHQAQAAGLAAQNLPYASSPAQGSEMYNAVGDNGSGQGENVPGDWVSDFLSNQAVQEEAVSLSRRSSFLNGPVDRFNVLALQDQQSSGQQPLQQNDDELVSHELAEIMRASAQSSSAPSTAASPMFPVDTSQPSFSPGHQQRDSLSNANARSPSPYLANMSYGGVSPSPPAGTYTRTGSASAASSPYVNKPQSPPALIIPNQNGSSPALAPIVTATNPQPAATATAVLMQHHPSGISGPSHLQSSSNNLLPPANPALEHLTGMAGISPIAPNADGPMIYIQPSTPISGLKEGRGVFEAAICRASASSNGQRQTGSLSQASGINDFAVAASMNSNMARIGAAGGFQHDPSSIDPAALMRDAQAWAQSLDIDPNNLRPANSYRPRAKSDSYTSGQGFDRQALIQMMLAQMSSAELNEALQQQQNLNGQSQNEQPSDPLQQAWQTTVNAWRQNQFDSENSSVPNPTLDPRNLPGNQQQSQQQVADLIQQNTLLQYQFNQLQAQRARLPALNTSSSSSTFKYEPGEFSPTSMAFYRQLGINPTDRSQVGTASAPGFQTAFQNIPQHAFPQSAAPTVTSFLSAEDIQAPGGRRRSVGEMSAIGFNHPAAGAGTPGYGVELSAPGMSAAPGRVRGVGTVYRHRRAAKSEDLGKGGTGWGMGAGGTTADFLQSITNPNDGTLLPPVMRGRSSSHSRNSSGSSARSASPALSISSQGSSMSRHSRMEMPEAPDQVPRVAKMKVTSVATEVASQSRRTNSGIFHCPIPGCGSTFTRHFNLKGHLRSHNDERPYKCLYDGCPKAIVGFARQHDCKRHMLLHEGLRPFECDGCGKKFARLDALTRHHKSEQGQECAISHPLPTNPDGSAMSESQYKAYRLEKELKASGGSLPKGVAGSSSGKGRARAPSWGGASADERSGGEEDIGTGSGMEDYDRL